MISTPPKIQMVDLQSQYQKLQQEMDTAILDVVRSGAYINGPAVKDFAKALSDYHDGAAVIPCANGTDALQIALMALELQPGDEVILPAFTYIATAEVIALLKLKPVLVDVDAATFNIDIQQLEKAITPKTKAIMVVHLFGQSAEMEAIMALIETRATISGHEIKVIEDNAQSIGADYIYNNGTMKKTGTIGHIGCTSFYPSKNLGCYGDGGAIFTRDAALAQHIQMIANHGQVSRYYHDIVGVNSRLDSIQAAILNIKLKRLDDYIRARQQAADYYDTAFAKCDEIQTPKRTTYSTHVFHQYSLQVKDGKRDALKQHLAERGIPSMIYYPLPVYKQKPYAAFGQAELPITAALCESVLSLPMHSELDETQLAFISDAILSFFK